MFNATALRVFAPFLSSHVDEAGRAHTISFRKNNQMNDPYPFSRSTIANSDGARLITPRRLKDDHSPAAVRLWVPTPWPEIGEPSLDINPDPRFNERIFSSRYVAGERIHVYIAGCRGLLCSVAQLLHIGAWKISTTQDESTGLENRLKALGKDRYGACHRSGQQLIEDRGFDEWVLSTLPDNIRLSPGSPLRLWSRGIEVILPSDLEPGRFDRLLRDALANAELCSWASSPDGLAHRSCFSLPLSRFHRFTAYGMVGSSRISAARELYLFKPHRQAQRLVRIVETIILEHVLRCCSISPRRGQNLKATTTLRGEVGKPALDTQSQ